MLSRAIRGKLSVQPAFLEPLWLPAQGLQTRETCLPGGRVELGAPPTAKQVLYKQRKERKGEASPPSPMTPVKVPDCPVPAWLLEELLRPPPAVSKEPLRNLNSCLQQLKYVAGPVPTCRPL